MNKKIATKVKEIAIKIAQGSIGKSWPAGAYEVEIPEQLLIKEEEYDQNVPNNG